MASETTLLHELFGPHPRILILRCAYLGDFLTITPALRALRRAVPGATIGVIVTPRNLALARRYPSIDEVFVTPPCRDVCHDGPEDPVRLRAFFRAMRDWRADLALQMTDDGDRTNRYVRNLGARLTAGIRKPGAVPLDLWIPAVKAQSMRLRYLDVLALFGVQATSVELELPLLPTDDAELEAALPEDLSLRQLDRMPLVGIHPSAKVGARRWPAERFAEVADRLVAEFGLRPVLLGAEVDHGAAMVAAMRERSALIDLTGRTSLGALIAIMRRLRLFVGNDSGPAHVAEAVGTASVVVYGVMHPFNWGPLFQTWHRIVADWTAPCRGFQPDGCPDDSSVPCLQAVTPDQVATEVRSLLECQQRIRQVTPP